MVDLKLLIVDDEEDMLDTCNDILSKEGYTISLAHSGHEAIKKMKEERFDVILTDLKMPVIDGIELLRVASRTSPGSMVILFTGYPTIQTAVEAMKQGAFDYITKPFTHEQLKIVVSKALSQKKLLEENRTLRQELKMTFRADEIIGTSDSIKRVLDFLNKISNTDSNILITGESGTGKELVAKGIHFNSSRSNKPFVPLDCGALPETLLESELFGYERGAFTGAFTSKQGLLEFANEGTLFIDEIGEMNLKTQVKFLRVLEERQLRRIGGRELVDLDLRVITATNKNLEELIKDQLFREDLYYRLNVIEIEMPPLRDRNGDILLLAEHFLREFCKGKGKVLKGFEKDVIDLFENYSWPGNIRELKNVVERAVSLADKEMIALKDIPHRIVKKEGLFDEEFLGSNFHRAKKEITNSFEKDYLISLLEKNKGNISFSAREAGINRTSLQRLLKKHNLNPFQFRR